LHENGQLWIFPAELQQQKIECSFLIQCHMSDLTRLCIEVNTKAIGSAIVVNDLGLYMAECRDVDALTCDKFKNQQFVPAEKIRRSQFLYSKDNRYQAILNILLNSLTYSTYDIVNEFIILVLLSRLIADGSRYWI